MKTFLLLLSLALPAFAAEDPVLTEIKANLEDTRQKIEEGKKQISSLEDNDKKIHKNLESIEESLQKKQKEKREADEVFSDYSQKLNSAGQAKRDFEGSVEKDKNELALVEKDIVAVKKKLVALEAAKKALQESIDIAEENLGKIDDRSSSWQKNKNKVSDEASEIGKDLATIQKKKDEQLKLQNENTAALAKWRKTVQMQEANLQKLDQRYKAAIREAEKAASKK